MKCSDVVDLLVGAGQFLLGLGTFIVAVKPTKKEPTKQARPRKFK